ncbi:hypothetical protein CJ030_MR1G018619 [Morella rubra]|uniref:Uncharacterized protein n=1 Tax=Morella rubra TaxID=262757 RepID=A0A6A1WP13_9ROSI|nr:hypothetical protein CJ030_MR1G018619 [Morella rubra]
MERHFDEARTPQEVKSRTPSNVNLDQFYNLVDFWFSATGQIVVKGANKVVHSKHPCTLEDLKALHVMLTRCGKLRRFYAMSQQPHNPRGNLERKAQSIGHLLTHMHKFSVQNDMVAFAALDWDPLLHPTLPTRA